MSFLSFFNPLSDDFAGGVFSGDDDEGEPTFYDPRADWSEGGIIKSDAYGPTGAADWNDERGFVLREGATAGMAREAGDQAIDLLRGQATGSAPSYAQLAADQQRRNMIQAAAAQAASGQGAYSPARQRAAAFGLTSALGQLGGATAAAQAQERIKAAQAYEAARRQRYAQELAAEQARRSQSIGLLGMKQNEQQRNRAAAIQENQDRINLAGRQQATQAGMVASEDANETNQNVAFLNAVGTAASLAGAGGKKK